MYKFRTKAQTLEFLSHSQKDLGFCVLSLIYFSMEEWKNNSANLWNQVKEKFSSSEKIIVRSSAKNEDTANSSQAGKFISVVCSLDETEFIFTVEKVFASYDTKDFGNQVLIQPAIDKVDAAGVAFTIDPNRGGNYYVINYDTSGSTSSITGGENKENKLFYFFKKSDANFDDVQPFLKKLCGILNKLEKLFETELLDIEFAVKDEEIYIFQARPLCLNEGVKIADINQQSEIIKRIKKYIVVSNKSKPFLYGEKTIYSNMTDWNPAEMIGVYPKNLALSLYKELITDNIWAYQRDNYGYKKLRSFPLMTDFFGIPYIDVRVSFNSFIPADLPDSVSEKLVNYYLDELTKNPQEHDKVEFDIIFSCYTFDLPERIKILKEHNFSDDEIKTIINSLRKLTNRITNSKNGLWLNDIEKIKILEKRYEEIVNSNLTDVEKMYWLTEDCKRYGTLPFAGLARAGFIAVQILQSMVKKNIIDREEYSSFMRDVTTVGSCIQTDFENLPKENFLKKYGHLRPGTYDITSARYDEKPELYFRSQEKISSEKNVPSTNFKMTLSQIKHIHDSLEKHKMNEDVLGLFTFIKSAIEGRESAKFIFTKNLSQTLKIFGNVCEKYGISAEESSYSDIQIVKNFYSTACDMKEILLQSIERGKKNYHESRQLVLPPLITSEKETEQFFIPNSQPTFITQKKIDGKVISVKNCDKKDLAGKILLIPSADPGFDWIFLHNIAGFVTEYGGANSHMAIRAAELNLPAVIGAGAKIFNRLQNSEVIEIDAASKKVIVLR